MEEDLLGTASAVAQQQEALTEVGCHFGVQGFATSGTSGCLYIGSSGGSHSFL